MKENPETRRLVIEFLSEELSLPSSKIFPLCRLRQDFGIDADHADELIRDFSYTFEVDISAFRINDYFGPQADINPVMAFFMVFFGNGRTLKTLKVSDLIRAAETRKLL